MADANLQELLYISMVLMLLMAVSKITAVVALIVNILIFPFGVGSIIGGRKQTGIIQVALGLVGIWFSITIIGLIIGVPLILVVWIWALITGIQIIKEST